MKKEVMEKIIKSKPNTYLVIIGAFALMIMVAAVLSSIFSLTFSVVGWVLSLGGIDNTAAILSGILALGFMVVYAAIVKPRTITQTLQALGMGFSQWAFLAWIYYGKITDYLVSAYGYEPRLVMLAQTPLLIVAVGIIYYGALDAYDVKPSAWKAYTLISVFGTVVIMLGIYAQPYVLFSHDADAPTPKFYVLRDENGKLIDVSYSPKFSVKYGKRLRPGTPADVPDVIKYKNANDIQAFLYRSQKEEQKGDDDAEDAYRPIFERVGVGRHIFTLNAGEKTAWKKIPPNMVWELYSLRKGDWDLIPFGGEIVSYKEGKSKYTDFGEMPMIFAVFAKEKMTFVLDVYPRGTRGNR